MTNYKEAQEQSLNYFQGNKIAAKVYLDKYALKSPDGIILEPTPDLMHRRLAKEFARIEAKYPNPLSEDEIFGYFDQFKYIIPQGSPMAGIGNPYQKVSLSNCFVIRSPYDSMSGIGMTIIEEKEIMKRRGGVGFDISTIRPKDMPTSNAAGTTDGIEVFMEDFSDACRRTAQNGRRGALMLTISVHHPEIRTFIHIKENLKKVTGANISIRLSDEFMNAVKNGTDVELRFPVDAKDPKVRQMVDAKALWEEIIAAAHQSAEPGLLFWDTIMKYCPANCYPDYTTISTNPCFSGETLIAVADGRNAVSIKQLAEEGKDVPVYSTDPKTGLVSIKTGRHPRITGYNKKLVRVLLDDGSHFDVTPDHKFMLRDGQAVEAKNLELGDSLSSFKKELAKVKQDGKYYFRIQTDTRSARTGQIFEHRLIAKFNQSKKWDEVYGNAKEGGWAKTGGLVVHHKDYNGLNNNPDNLEIMTFKEHQKFHAEHDNTGENNGRYSGITNAQLKNHALNLTRRLNRRFSTDEWQNYAQENKLPQGFSGWRQMGFYKSPTTMAHACAMELGMDHVDLDPRLVKTCSLMLEQGYEVQISGNQVVVRKICETCGSDFSIEHNKREAAFCSLFCSLTYINSNKEISTKRTEGRNRAAAEKSEKTSLEQARIFSALKFSLKREPLMKEWEQSCKAENIPARIGKVMKHGFKNWTEVQEAGNSYNHKVVSVTELPETHTVYNLTVDDYHTVAIVNPVIEKDTHMWYSGVNVWQCGEITLSAYDSCRLLLMNVLSFVKNPFTKQAQMDWKKFAQVVQVSQRLMDDLVDLELEAVEKILAKIESDPEPPEVKSVELALWNKIKVACINGRRTGLGFTAVGDLVAAMGMQYGSEDSLRFVEHLYRLLAVNSYSSSVTMAEERGAFPVFSHELEKDHPFLQRIWDADKDLYQRYLKHGRRNIANLTTAPAGSVSMITKSVKGFGTSSGIENVPYIRSVRRKKINPTDKDAKIDFVDDMGDKWSEFAVCHSGFEAWKEINGKTDADIQESPYWNSTINDVNWVAKVDMQGLAQKWIDHSISNTTNLPEDVSLDTVKDVYMRGWEQGCKGITIYRNNSRAGVILEQKTEKLAPFSELSNEKLQELITVGLNNIHTSSDVAKAKLREMQEERARRTRVSFEDTHAPKRPDSVECDVYHSTIQGEKWTIFVGKLSGRPYELMGGLSKFVNLPKRVRTGKILKHNGEINPARYDFHYDFDKGPEDEAIISDIGNVFENPVHSAFTRSISLNLRHGVPVQFICEQLLKGAEKDSDLFSFSKVMSRVLKNYIQDGSKTTQKGCPDCKSTNLSYQQGCVICLDCGASKCS